jgi:hypothetical protein
MDGTDMSRVIAIVAAAGTLAGCASWAPDLAFLPKSEPVPVTVQFQSEPAGAEATVSAGASCQTPCALAVAPDQEFSVTFALAGYQPQTVPVQVRTPEGLSGAEAEAEKALMPNPVYVELEPAPKAPARKPAPAKKPVTAAAQPPASKPAPVAWPEPPFNPAPAAIDPWPPVR